MRRLGLKSDRSNVRGEKQGYGTLCRSGTLKSTNKLQTKNDLEVLQRIFSIQKDILLAGFFEECFKLFVTKVDQGLTLI